MAGKMNEAFIAGREVIEQGEVATYIPELGKANKNDLGVCIKTLDGKVFTEGDYQKRFTIQSISKVVSLSAAIQICGYDKVFSKVGMEPSGESFNSLVELDLRKNLPFNPMINSGALTTASLLVPYMTFEDMLDYTKKVCMDEDITMNDEVYRSEMQNASRNRAIAYLLESKGIIENGVDRSLMLYTKMCSMSVTAESLANFALLLANDGVSPVDNKRLIDSRNVQVLKTIMLTCGMYDGSGEFAVKVGLPSKSGVGGGLMSVCDKEAGIGIYGPSLDDKGNSIAGCKILEVLSNKMDLHLFSRTKMDTE